MELYTVNNLSSILFYSGEYANEAAQQTESRNYGSYVEGLGNLTKTPDALSTWSNYTSVQFEETTPDFKKIEDIYNAAYSYETKWNSEYSVGTTYIADNKYNAIYTYEIQLNNLFENANPAAKKDLKNFLMGLNEQVFNKQKYYGDEYEIKSLVIGPTTFTWYPENTVAYTYSYATPYEAWSYTWTENIMESEEAYTAAYTAEDLDTVHAYYYNAGTALNPQWTEVVVTDSYSYTAEEMHYVDYVIGPDFYSYTRQTYNTIDSTLEASIQSGLDTFAEKYNHDESIYSYYIYDCNADIQMTVSTKSVGTKKSVFQIRFDSIYNQWFTYNIKLNANVNDSTCTPEGDSFNLMRISSADDNAIFGVRLNENTELTGENVTLNADEFNTFATTQTVVNTDVISVLTPQSIKVLDLSPMKYALTGEINLTESEWNIARGCSMEQFIIGDGTNVSADGITKISGINDLSTIKYIDIENLNGLTATPSISNLENLKVYKAAGSSTTTFKPKDGAVLYNVTLPQDSLKVIKLKNVTFEEGELNVNGVDTAFDGKLHYIPDVELKSLTFDNVKGIDTYEFINTWYSVLTQSGSLDSVLYLALKNFTWDNVPMEFMYKLRRFDINEINGTINIKGTGNYGWLSRSDYQDICKLYGANAFGTPTQSNKIYPDLILTYKAKETFEYSLNVEALDMIQKHADETARYEAMSDLDKSNYWAPLTQSYPENLAVTIVDNRAGNAFLDLLPIESMEFIWDDVEKYAYCQLSSSIDTTNSEEISNVKAGDILLYNGDTVIIYGEDVDNPLYEFVKIGHIEDVKVRYKTSTWASESEYSTIKGWLNTDALSHLHFIPSERPRVMTDIHVTGNNYVFDGGDDSELTLTVNAQNSDIEENDLQVNYDTNLITLTETTNQNLGEDDPITYPRIYKITVKDTLSVERQVTNIEFAATANVQDTKVTYKINIMRYDEPSEVNENGILLLNNADFNIDEEGILHISRTAATYDEATNTIQLN